MRQKTIKCCGNTLCCCAFLVTMIAGLMAWFTVMVGEHETLNILISTAFHQGKKMTGQEIPKEVEKVKPIVVLGGIMIAITTIGILMAICVRLTMNCICVTFELIVLLALTIVLLIFGIVLVVPAFWGVGYIQQNCGYISKGDIDSIDQYSIRVFEPIYELDKAFQTGVNKQMCSKFCTCPGTISDEHYKQYEQISETEYKKYDRTFYPTTDFEALRTAQPADPKKYREAIMNDKSLHWLPEGANTQILTETMFQCYEEAVKIQAQMALIDGQETAAEQEKSLKQAKPDKAFIDIVSHIEKQYSCSGLCEKPLFYLTQSIRKGPPQTPCLEPLIGDISSSLKNLGIALVLTGLFFFMMIFISIPICCYSKEQELAEKDMEQQSRERSRAEMYEI